MKRILALFIAPIIFLGTLELLSWIALKAGVSVPQSSPPVVSGKGEERVQRLLRDFENWKTRHPEVKTSVKNDEELRHEESRYHHFGVQSKKYLFNRFDELAAGIDDDYILFGRKTGRIKYKAHYRTDEYGRRVTGYENVPDPKLNIIFLGCSFTFGEGVDDEYSLPAQMGKRLEGVRVYNLGNPGSSIAGRLALLQKKPELLNGIDPKIPTILIYVFLDDHLRRMAGTSELFHRGDFLYRESPAFSLRGDELILENGFDENFWNFRWLAFWYSKTNFSKLTRLELPPISESQFRIQEKILASLENEVKKVLPLTKETVVATFPGENFYAGKMAPYLKNVTFLDYSGVDFNGLALGNFHLPGDHHPSELAYEFFSELLANDLKSQL